MDKARRRIPATGISGVTGAVAIVGASMLGGAGAGLRWAIGFGLVVLTLGLVLEYRRSRRATYGGGVVVTKSFQPGYQIDDPGNSWFPKPRVEPTWLLTVRDHAGRNHHLEVDEATWQRAKQGDPFKP